MIVLDAGNTSISAARWAPNEVNAEASPEQMNFESLGSLPTPADAEQEAACVSAVKKMCHDDDSIVLVSVVPAVTGFLVAAIPQLSIVDHTRSWPFDIEVDDPAAVGADRYANLGAAVAMGWSSALIVDVGTATTLDVLENGTFVGGLIAPGPAFAARCLGKTAARLAPVPFGTVPLAPGQSTAEAMAVGAFHVGVRGILGTIRALQNGHPERPVVLTGGLAEALRSHDLTGEDPIDFHADRFWTLKGAALSSC